MLSKIKQRNLYLSKTPHIIINGAIETKEYDWLYEQWNRPTHERWKKFTQEHNIQITFNDELKPVQNIKNKEYIGYWFFRQRSDRRSIMIDIKDTKVEYKSNTLLIMKNTHKFKVINNSSRLPYMLNITIKFDKKQQEKLIELLDHGVKI